VSERENQQLERWLNQIDDHKPLAIIMGGSVNGLSFVRSLGRRKVPTLLLDSDRLIGIYTRYGKVQILPDCDRHPEPWIELFEFIGSRAKSTGVLFATSDEHVLFIAKYSESFSRYFRFIKPNVNTLEQIVNKRSQYTIAEKAGISIPRTHFPESLDEVHALSNDVPYPCILKPYRSHLARKKMSEKVLVVNSSEELSDRFLRVATGDVQFMIQEIIPGDDSALFGYLAFWDESGAECGWLTKRKLRQFPPHYGHGSLQITVQAPEVRELSRRLLQTFNFKGFVGIEFKYDSRDETYRLMEINPRTVSGNQLAISAGVDFPWIGYKYLTGNDHEQVLSPSFLPEVQYMNEEWDFKAFLSLRKSGKLTFVRWVRSVRGSKAKAIWAWDDPLPMIVVLWRFLRAFLRALCAGVRAKIKVRGEPVPNHEGGYE
jgi:D-aspartate ligase